MADTLKYGFLGHREKMKYNGRSLRMKIYRLGGYAPIKKKIKIKSDNIVRLVWAESDRLDSKIFQAIKGENGALVWSRQRNFVVDSSQMKSLDQEAEDQSGDDAFEDDEPDDD